eukprot:TRINITY_DN16977_c0_g2_i1.p1 TRINITY_DN16977_c0_g2~~TRINITY_DN16977_c0_g2_i1.p1  ORF type:complete len:504 (-),score=105.51 TRINITY_DN16977_c0_g2_i1:34-1515(-)
MAACVVEPEDYGKQYFLSNYRCGPLPVSVAKLLSLDPLSPGTIPGKQEQLSTGPAALVQPAVQKVTSSSESADKLFSLAPPPPPAPIASVGSQMPMKDIVVIETLREETPIDKTQRQKMQEEVDAANPTGAVYLDDEESLLDSGAAGGKANGSSSTSAQRAGLPQSDGVDSESGSEEAVDVAKGTTSLEGAPGNDSPETNGGEEKSKQLWTLIEEDDKPAEDFAGSSGAAVAVAPRSGGKPSERKETSSSTAVPTTSSVRKPEPVEQHNSKSAAGGGAKAAVNSATPDAISGERMTVVVRVPKPYPGVQLRRSMRLDDKLERFLEDGKKVSGVLDASGQWLMIGPDNYLPMHVGDIKILQPVVEPSDTPAPAKRKAAKDVQKEDANSFWWWGCCAGAAADVVSNGNADVLVTPGDSVRLRGVSTDSAVAGASQVPRVSKQTVAPLGTDTAQPAGARSQAQRDDGTGMTQLPRHISNPIDPFSDGPDLLKRRGR